MTPRVGQWLFSSCKGDDYGEVVAVGKDLNGAATIDIRVLDPNDLGDCDDDSADNGATGWDSPLTTIEVEGNVVLRGVQYREVQEAPDPKFAPRIVCNTPGSGCYRCTKLFFLNDKPAHDQPPRGGRTLTDMLRAFKLIADDCTATAAELDGPDAPFVRDALLAIAQHAAQSHAIALALTARSSTPQ